METSSQSGPWGLPGQVFDQLEGSWSLERSIEALGASMHGTAHFTSVDGGLRYREEGLTRLANGALLKAHREYHFEHRPLGFAVYFVEVPPRLFHEIDLEPIGALLAATARHECAPDTYQSRYEFLPDGSFTLRHEVHGPRKAYTSTSIFRRISCPPPSSG